MTHARALTTGGTWRDQAWPALVALVFVPAQILALLAASRLTTAMGVGMPEREHFAAVATLLGGLSMLVVVPVSGRLLGHRVRLTAGWGFGVPLALAVASAYVLFEDVRSGLIFETDHALPEIFVPEAILLLASGALGHRLAGADSARRGWKWVVVIAAVAIVGLVALSAAKMVAWGGGDFALDSPVTALMLVVIGAYAAFAGVSIARR